MGFNDLRAGVTLRVAALLVTMIVTAWVVLQTHWYASMALALAAVIAQIALLLDFIFTSEREVARLLDAISLDDVSQTFSGLGTQGAHRELGTAMGRVLERLRASRADREAQARHLHAVLEHIPVALLAIDNAGNAGTVRLLNAAARRLFEAPLQTAVEFQRHGIAFVTAMASLRPGSAAVVPMERKTGTLHLKVAATDFAVGGVRQRLISLQNVETELSAQELVAWQSVVRVMAHEVMNSLTPMTSLSATALDLVRSVLDKTPPGSPNTEALSEALLALETASSRSEALLHFVQNHRRLTKRLEAKIGTVRVGRLFAQLGRLLASELALRGIVLEFSVEPGNLEIAADADLLEQAFINLIRNAMEALGDRSDGRIELSSRRSPDGRTLLAVADNGPGIPLALNERVFVPFFTTKRHGSGVGLTLVRQIAMVHEATVGISETPGGGATISLRF